MGKILSFAKLLTCNDSEIDLIIGYAENLFILFE